MHAFIKFGRANVVIFIEELYKKEGYAWADSSNLHFICISQQTKMGLRCFDALQMDHLSMFLLVLCCCGLTSHSAIFKLIVTRQLPSFEIKTYCQVPAPWAARYHHTGTWTSEDVFNFIAVGGRASWLGTNVDLPIHCPVRYLYATGTGHGDMKTLIRCWRILLINATDHA